MKVLLIVVCFPKIEHEIGVMTCLTSLSCPLAACIRISMRKGELVGNLLQLKPSFQNKIECHVRFCHHLYLQPYAPLPPRHFKSNEIKKTILLIHARTRKSTISKEPLFRTEQQFRCGFVVKKVQLESLLLSNLFLFIVVAIRGSCEEMILFSIYCGDAQVSLQIDYFDTNPASDSSHMRTSTRASCVCSACLKK